MRLKQDSSKQKLRGAYYTPLPLARKMIELFKDNPTINKIFEPSCGDGVFLDGLIQADFLSEDMEVTAVEIDQEVAARVSEQYQNIKNIKVCNTDFFDFYEEMFQNVQYDLILGNPPYIRYQYLDELQRQTMSDILTSHGMKANKLVNAWVGFLVACVQMLSDHGKIAFVIPAEILQVAYAEDLRLFLTNTLPRITLITFKKLIFPDIEQEVVVLIGEKGGVEKGIRIIELNDLDDLETLDVNANEFQKLQHVHEKWTKYFTKVEENNWINQIRKDERFQSMSEIALINVGITTGNNKYFSVDDSLVNQYELRAVTRPLIGRSSHVNGIYYKEEDWKSNINVGKAAYLINFPDIPFGEYPAKHKKYIKLGEKNKEHGGYKCSIRERWYRIPSIWTPDAFFLRRNNLYPKFVLNQCDAVSTDTMHRIKFYEGVEPEKILLSYYNSVSFAFTEICGRSYGGGVLEILPGEVGNIVLPKINDMDIDKVRELLLRIDTIVRNGQEIEIVLDLVDEEVLVKLLKLDPSVCKIFRDIWNKLRRRRLGRG